MYVFNNLWLSQAKQIVQSFEVFARILKTLAAIGRFGQIESLNQRALGTIEDHDAFAEQLLQLLRPAYAVEARMAVHSHAPKLPQIYAQVNIILS